MLVSGARCWSIAETDTKLQLVSVMTDLLGDSAADTATRDASERESDKPAYTPDSPAIIDPSLSRPELDSALSKRLPSTRKLISSFVESSKNGISPAVQDLHSKCSKLQAEVSSTSPPNHS